MTARAFTGGEVQDATTPSFYEEKYEGSTFVTSTPKKNRPFLDASYFGSLSPIRDNMRPGILDYKRAARILANGYRHDRFVVGDKETCVRNLIYDLEVKDVDAETSTPRKQICLSLPNKDSTCEEFKQKQPAHQIIPGSRRSGRKRVAAKKCTCE